MLCHSEKTMNNSKFNLQTPNSCFKAKAIPKSKSKTWFQIDYNSETGEVSKSCGDSSKYGCSKGNTWQISLTI